MATSDIENCKLASNRLMNPESNKVCRYIDVIKMLVAKHVDGYEFWAKSSG